MSTIGKLNAPPATNNETNSPTKAAENKLREVAELYENQFIRQMIKQMRSTVQESDLLKKNNAEKIFSSQLDEQYADQWTKSGGIGLSDMIYNQLVEQFGVKMGLKTPMERPQGPLSLDQKSNFAGSAVRSTEGSSGATFRLENQSQGKAEIKNPWVGVLLDKKFMDMNNMQYRIKHDNGLESFITANGSGMGAEQNLSVGDRIGAGQQLGWAAPASPLFWTVKEVVSE